MSAPIQGHCDQRFEPVKAAFEANFREHGDIGASVAITLDGEFVVDLWGGHQDEERTQPWQEDSLVNVWSSTKTMAAMSLLLLADRGEVDLHAPAAKYWPEFAQNGKESVEVRHFLSHTAGLSGMDEKVEGDALYDWEWMTSALARQEPWWNPGTQSGYHALTQGHLIGRNCSPGDRSIHWSFLSSGNCRTNRCRFSYWGRPEPRSANMRVDPASRRSCA